MMKKSQSQPTTSSEHDPIPINRPVFELSAAVRELAELLAEIASKQLQTNPRQNGKNKDESTAKR